MEVISKIAGINIIFIANSMPIDYDIISQNAINIGKALLLPDEKYSINVTTTKKNMLKDDKILFFKKDLEFFIISELSSISAGTKYVRNESEADKIFRILIGSDVAYISTLQKKGTGLMPFDYLNEIVACPLYEEEHSFLSLISLLNSGFFPSPFIFYSNRTQLLKILKLFDKIIKRYPVYAIEMNLIDISNISLKLYESILGYDISSSEKKILLKLIMDSVIVKSILKLKTNNNFVCLPFVSYIHPMWFIKENVISSFGSGKIPLTPLIYNSEYKKTLDYYNKLKNYANPEQLFAYDDSFFDLKQQTFEDLFKKSSTLIKMPPNKITKKDLVVGEDDILDILDSI
jgi:hypothetical protein